MNKIWLIIEREYLTRVKKKSFLVLTLLGPVLMAAGLSLVVWLGASESQEHQILVVDEKSPAFKGLSDKQNIHYEYGNGMTIQQAKDLLYESDYTCVLYIPENIEASNTAKLYFKKQPSSNVLRAIENDVEEIVEELKLNFFLAEYHIDKDLYRQLNTNFILNAVKYSEKGEEEKLAREKTLIGFGFGLLIYLFVFLYGVQVMRGVIEEKSNRIIEVIVTSVRPFQLMMGKIVGVSLVSMTQFVLWIVLTIGIFSGIKSVVFTDSFDPATVSQQVQATPEVMKEIQEEEMSKNQILDPNNIINRTNWTVMISLFLFYFLGGYFLYSALFAAIGAAVDSETDTQQFMFPVTMPLTLGYILSLSVIENPEGQLAFWLSMIPFTSPITMLVRVAIGVGEGGIPIWEVALSMALLVLGFVGTVWLAARIYRTGILMYGKKVTYRELLKWITYKHH
jgi:ABC-2 type transport system permease protein